MQIKLPLVRLNALFVNLVELLIVEQPSKQQHKTRYKKCFSFKNLKKAGSTSAVDQ
jgi:hypothetical protein